MSTTTTVQDEIAYDEDVAGVYSHNGKPLLEVHIATRDSARAKWFGVSERAMSGGAHDGEPVAYIVQGSAVPGTAYEWVRAELGARRTYRPSPWGMVFCADNRTQVKDWLLEHGLAVEWQGYRVAIDVAKRQERRDKVLLEDEVKPDIRTPQDRATLLRAKADRIEQERSEQAARLRAEADRYDALPAEPDVEPGVIFFEKRFQVGGRVYNYGAVKATDGLWWTTGPNSPKGYTWEALIQWIMPDDGSEPPEVWFASELSQLI